MDLLQRWKVARHARLGAASISGDLSRGFVRSERKTQRVWPMLWNGGNPGLIVQQCLLVLRQLLGKECVAYIPSEAPASASPAPTLTVSTGKFKRLHTKNNKGRKHSEHTVLIYWHLPGGGDRDAVHKETHGHETVFALQV